MPERRTTWSYNEMGVFFYSRGAYDLAISEFKQALLASLLPAPNIHANLGAAYFEKRMYAEAERALRESLRLDGRLQNARVFLGRTLLAKGDEAGALSEFERAIALDPATDLAKFAADEVRRLRSSHTATTSPHTSEEQPWATS